MNLKALQSLEIVIAADGIEQGLLNRFKDRLQQVLHRTRLAIRVVERGIVVTIL